MKVKWCNYYDIKNAPPKFLENNPLIIVDDEIMPLDFDINSIDPSEIKSIEVLKSGSVMEAYGKKAIMGCIINKNSYNKFLYFIS